MRWTPKPSNDSKWLCKFALFPRLIKDADGIDRYIWLEYYWVRWTIIETGNWASGPEVRYTYSLELPREVSM